MRSPPRSRRHAKTQVGSPRSTVTDTSRTSRRRKPRAASINSQQPPSHRIIAARAARIAQRNQGRPPPDFRPPPPTLTFVCPPTPVCLSSLSPLCHLFARFGRASRARQSWDTFFSGLAGGEKSRWACVQGNAIRDTSRPIADGPIRHQTMGDRLPVWAKSARPDPSVDCSGSVVGPVCLERQPLSPGSPQQTPSESPANPQRIPQLPRAATTSKQARVHSCKGLWGFTALFIT